MRASRYRREAAASGVRVLSQILERHAQQEGAEQVVEILRVGLACDERLSLVVQTDAFEEGQECRAAAGEKRRK